MIANGLLAAIAYEFVGPIHDRRGDRRQIRLDARLILGSRRHDADGADGPLGIEVVPVPANAARGLGAAEAGSGARRDRQRRERRRFVGRNQSERLLAGVDDLERAHDDALERVAADGAEPGAPRESLYRCRQAIEVERVACERSDEIGTTPLHRRMQSGRMRDLPLLELRLVVGDIDIDVAIRHQPSLIDRVFVGMAQRDELVIPLERWKRKSRDPAHETDGELACVCEAFLDGRQLRSARRSIEPAGLDVDGVYSRPPSARINSLPAFFTARPLRTASPCSRAIRIASGKPRKSGACSITTCSAWLSIHSPQ